MEQFTAHQLWFTCEVMSDLYLQPFNGPSLRGALFNALLDQFCMNRAASSCLTCPLNAGCPISRLAATVDPQSTRGQEVPRPFSIEPVVRPLPEYRPGARFQFGVTLLSEAVTLFPYLFLGVQAMGQTGIGRREGERGRFRIQAVAAVNPFTGEQQALTDEGGVVRMPSMPVRHEQVEQAARGLHGGLLMLSFLTPMRLVAGGELVRRPDFRIVMQRLFRRLTDLCEQTGPRLQLDFQALLARSEAVQLVEDRTRWADLESHSQRQRRWTPIGGFMGEATYGGPFARFLPYLLWGSVTHIGKDITKGNGWYRVSVTDN